MNLGTLLVIFGLFCVVVDTFITYPTNYRYRRATLLHLGVILIGIGVLVGVKAITGT